MPVKRNVIVQFCQEFLKVKDFQDYCHNGLQVQGKVEIGKIVTGVTFSKKLIEAAIEKKADMLLVHHGMFGNQLGTPPVIKGVIRDRIKLIMEHDINLMGFHLPLDAHPEIGNNISLCKVLGLAGQDQISLGLSNLKPVSIGFLGSLPQPIPFETFVETVNEKLGSQSFVIAAGAKEVHNVAIISGGSSPHFEEAIEAGADTFIAGDVREEVVRAVEEAGINFINAGHYNTEKLGIQNLGNVVAKQFGVEVEFVDIPCDV